METKNSAMETHFQTHRSEGRIQETQSFKELEFSCMEHFSKLPRVYHSCTPEDHPIVFTGAADFKAGVSILGICTKLYPQVRLYTFQLMSNHAHFVVSGPMEDIEAMFTLFKKKLECYFETKGYQRGFKAFVPRHHPIDDLDYFRAAIAYVNRNGFLVNDGVTPFTYEWGANNCYFNPVLKKYYEYCSKPTRVRDVRQLFTGKLADKIEGLQSLDDYVSPLSFCDIESGEKAFRNARHYFYQVSKNVESYGKIASIIGESICYSDEDIYSIAHKLSADYGVISVSHLCPDAKMDIARKLHYEYHAGDKQIQRILKLDASVVKALF